MPVDNTWSVYQRKDSPYYWFKIRDSGQRKFAGSTGCTQRREAERYAQTVLAEKEAELANGAAPAPHAITLAHVLTEFKERRADTKKSHKTMQGHLMAIGELCDPTALYADVDTKFVEDFVEQLVARGKLGRGIENKKQRVGALTQTTVNRYLATWQNMHNYAGRVRGYKTNVVLWDEVRGAEPESRDARLTEEQAQMLLDELPEHARDIVWFIIYTGARKNQVLKLTRRQANIARREVSVRRMKRKTHTPEFHTIPLNMQAHLVLQKRLASPGHPDDLVFDTTNFRKHFEAARANAGVDDARVHDLRHAFGTWLRRRGVRLEVISKLLGHSSLAVTMRYIRVFEEDQREAADQMPGLALGNVQPLQISSHVADETSYASASGLDETQENQGPRKDGTNS